MRGSITKHADGVWRLAVNAGNDPVTGKRRRIVRLFHGGRRAAELELARLVNEMGHGDAAGHDATVGQLVARWHALGRGSASYRRDIGHAIGHIPPALAAMPIHKVRPHDLDALYGHLGRTLGPDRIRRVHTILRQSFAQAVKWQWITSNPANDASPPPAPKTTPRPPSPDAVRKLLAAADGELLTFITLSAALGQRRGTTVALKWSDIDLVRRQAVIRRAVADGGRGVGIVVKGTKTDTEHTVSIDETTVALLIEHRRFVVERCEACGVDYPDDGYLFSTLPDGSVPWRPDHATRLFGHLRDRVGLGRSVQLRHLRHFVATELLAAGVDPRTVAGRLGHARTSTTLDIYAAFVPARDQVAADVMGSVLRGE